MTASRQRPGPSVVVHGGAGTISADSLAARLRGCREAVERALAVLRADGSALDAAEAAVVVLENDPIFNAGTGAALNREGEVELDASIMDGNRLAAGAVAAVRNIKNPISLARRVMDDGSQVLLAGPGANDFARQAGITECPAEELITAAARRRLASKHGTVGSVVADRHGALAAATSTGGLTGKPAGRVGDSALIGCGTYADDRSAVSCTGIGEAIIRVVLAKAVADRVRWGLAPQQAAQQGVDLLEAVTGDECGVIVVDRLGRIGCAHNAAHMPVCHCVNGGGPVTTG